MMCVYCREEKQYKELSEEEHNAFLIQCMEKDVDTLCPICMEDIMSSTESIVVLSSCNHIGHMDCYRRWTTTHTRTVSYYDESAESLDDTINADVLPNTSIEQSWANDYYLNFNRNLINTSRNIINNFLYDIILSRYAEDTESNTRIRQIEIINTNNYIYTSINNNIIVNNE